eukprot:2127969-Prymnesium_polylepis.1
MKGVVARDTRVNDKLRCGSMELSFASGVAVSSLLSETSRPARDRCHAWPPAPPADDGMPSECASSALSSASSPTSG